MGQKAVKHTKLHRWTDLPISASLCMLHSEQQSATDCLVPRMGDALCVMHKSGRFCSTGHQTNRETEDSLLEFHSHPSGRASSAWASRSPPHHRPCKNFM